MPSGGTTMNKTMHAGFLVLYFIALVLAGTSPLFAAGAALAFFLVTSFRVLKMIVVLAVMIGGLCVLFPFLAPVAFILAVVFFVLRIRFIIRNIYAIFGRGLRVRRSRSLWRVPYRSSRLYGVCPSCCSSPRAACHTETAVSDGLYDDAGLRHYGLGAAAGHCLCLAFLKNPRRSRRRSRKSRRISRCPAGSRCRPRRRRSTSCCISRNCGFS